MRASELLGEAGLPREAAKVESTIASLLLDLNRGEEASERLERVYEAVDDGSDDEVVAELAFRRASLEHIAGRPERGLPLIDQALRIGERLRLAQITVRAMLGKGILLRGMGRIEEPTALLERAAELALEQDLTRDAVTVYFNLAEFVMSAARFEEAESLLDRGLALVHERGDRRTERWLLAQSIQVLFALGRWDQALERIAAVRQRGDDMFGQYVLSLSPYVLGARGDVDGLVALLGPLEAITGWRNSELIGAVGRAIVLRETGRAAEAVAIAQEATFERLAHPSSEGALMFAEAVDCALAGDQPEAAQALLGQVDSLAPVELLPLLEAEAMRARARLDAFAGAIDGAEQQFTRDGTAVHAAASRSAPRRAPRPRCPRRHPSARHPCARHRTPPRRRPRRRPHVRARAVRIPRVHSLHHVLLAHNGLGPTLRVPAGVACDSSP